LKISFLQVLSGHEPHSGFRSAGAAA